MPRSLVRPLKGINYLGEGQDQKIQETLLSGEASTFQLLFRLCS